MIFENFGRRISNQTAIEVADLVCRARQIRKIFAIAPFFGRKQPIETVYGAILLRRS